MFFLVLFKNRISVIVVSCSNSWRESKSLRTHSWVQCRTGQRYWHTYTCLVLICILPSPPALTDYSRACWSLQSDQASETIDRPIRINNVDPEKHKKEMRERKMPCKLPCAKKKNKRQRGRKRGWRHCRIIVFSSDPLSSGMHSAECTCPPQVGIVARKQFVSVIQSEVRGVM